MKYQFILEMNNYCKRFCIKINEIISQFKRFLVLRRARQLFINISNYTKQGADGQQNTDRQTAAEQTDGTEKEILASMDRYKETVINSYIWLYYDRTSETQ